MAAAATSSGSGQLTADLPFNARNDQTDQRVVQRFPDSIFVGLPALENQLFSLRLELIQIELSLDAQDFASLAPIQG